MTDRRPTTCARCGITDKTETRDEDICVVRDRALCRECRDDLEMCE